jgi:hypothetical protein
MRIWASGLPDSMRWARFTFPDGTHKDVLQQSFVTRQIERSPEGEVIGVRTDVEWRDVPVWFQPYEAAK